LRDSIDYLVPQIEILQRAPNFKYTSRSAEGEADMESPDAKGHAESSVKLTEANFDKLSSSGKPMFVDFWAVWCGPCRIMDPVVEKLAAKYSDRILFGKVNVDEEMNISSRYQVFSIPTFMIFKNGQPMDAVIGAVGEASLERLLKSAIDGAPS
jgi:thioredoxin 1